MAGIFEIFHKGDFKNIERFLKAARKSDFYQGLGTLANKGSAALAAATPRASGVTAESWGWEIEITNSGVDVNWTNTNTNQGFNVAIGLQYGHGTGTGGWVAGQDYINPAITPILDEMAEHVWKAVTSA